MLQFAICTSPICLCTNQTHEIISGFTLGIRGYITPEIAGKFPGRNICLGNGKEWMRKGDRLSMWQSPMHLCCWLGEGVAIGCATQFSHDFCTAEIIWDCVGMLFNVLQRFALIICSYPRNHYFNRQTIYCSCEYFEAHMWLCTQVFLLCVYIFCKFPWNPNGPTLFPSSMGHLHLRLLFNRFGWWLQEVEIGHLGLLISNV